MFTHHISSNRKAKMITALALATAYCLLAASNTMAVTTPASGSFLYDLYDIAVVQILQGPGGFVGGCAVMIIACVLLVRQMILPGACAMLGGALILKADSLVSSLGAIIS